MKQFLSQHKDWVIDGNYSWCCTMRKEWSKPTTLSFSISLVGTASIEPGNDTVVIKGRVRESMAAGCPERFDWEFIRWILWDGRTKMPQKGIEISVLPIPTNLSLSRIKKSWMHF